MLRIGLMGAGTVASYGHLPGMAAVPDIQIAAVFDPNADNLKAAQQRFHIPQAFNDAEKFFQSGIDAVSITSPAFCHLQNVKDAARYGKPVLCEKPLAMNDQETQEMIRVMEQAKLGLWTGFTYRFSPMAQKIKALVAEEVIGKIRALRFVYTWNAHGKFERDAQGNLIIQKRRAGRMLEGGPMVDCGVHDIDLARWWLQSEVVQCDGFGAWVEDYEAPDHVWLHMDHACGAHAMVELSFSYCHTAKEPAMSLLFELIGTDGLIRYDYHQLRLEVRNSQGTQYYYYGDTKEFAAMYRAFVEAVTTGQAGCLATAQDGYIATHIARVATDKAIAKRPRP